MRVIREQYPPRRCVEETIPLARFADRHGLALKIVEHWQGSRPKYWADLSPFTEIIQGSMLAGVGAFGDTEAAAIEALCRRISRQRLVTGAHTPARREYDAPTIVPGFVVDCGPGGAAACCW